MRQGLPIGYEDFKEIIEHDLYYVDKTLMIKRLIDRHGKVSLFTRPRRFGKTLNLSMLKYFFERQTDEKGDRSDNSYLFRRLKIAGCGGQYMTFQGKYPVINLSLKSARQPDFEMAYKSLVDEIAKEFDRHAALLDSGRLDEGEKERFLLIMRRKAEKIDYAKSLDFLSACLAKHYKENVIILIDEYDVPLENAYFEGFYSEMTTFIRSLFESALKTNSNLEFGVITGCLRISKESIFTRLNNLDIYSIINPWYAEDFGFTEDEIRKLLQDYGLMDKFSEVKSWYDGYLFGVREIYNPWSIINYIQTALGDRNSYPRPYWSNTSSNSIVRELVEGADLETRREIEELIAGRDIEKPVHEDITYEDIHESKENLWNFLYFTGYFRKLEEFQKDEVIYLRLTIPNVEIRSIYKKTILSWFNRRIKKADVAELILALEKGDGESAGSFLSKQLMETISFYDYAENYYHGFLAGLLKCQDKYEILSNRESGLGRPDIAMREMKFRGMAIILELKTAEKFEDMERLCGEALEQIGKQQYEKAFWAEGCCSVKKYLTTPKGIWYSKPTYRLEL